jgi:hypothetical protein
MAANRSDGSDGSANISEPVEWLTVTGGMHVLAVIGENSTR